jgi:choline dehydrogenase-like flavoprotein
MLIDGRAVPDGAALDTELCIIGAGPAGITLAHALIGHPLKVLLLESGGFEFDDAVQGLSEHDSVDLPYDLAQMRLRYFGGCSNHWGGYCRPLEPATFARRPWIAHSGWPIDGAELGPHYDAAAALCQIGPLEPDAAAWAERLRLAALPLAPDGDLADMLFQLSRPIRFGEAYRRPLVQAANVTLCLNGTATALTAHPAGGHVEQAEIGTLGGGRFAIRARAFVLACGGIENARLLLASNDVEPAGLGNRNDLVGRFFTDHAHFHLGELALAAPADPQLYLEPVATGPGRAVVLHLQLTAAAQARERLPEVAVKLRPGLPSAGERSLRSVATALRMGRMPPHLSDHLGNMIRDIGGVGGALARMAQHKLLSHELLPRHPGVLALRSVGELVPDPANRVRLGRRRDRLGQPLARLDWQPTSFDRAAMRRLGMILAQELGRQGLGRVMLPEAQPFIDGGWHHMGTTRMSDHPGSGVVDRNLRVHGIDNLYIAGSSVFPTGGSGAPTLTIVALSVRLAEHLRAALVV